jgi:hypothetical protein
LQQQQVTVSGTSGGGGAGKHTAQSIAQILGEVDKRKKKTTPGLLPSGKKKSAKEILGRVVFAKFTGHWHHV